MKHNIRHSQKQKRFEVEVDGRLAYLEYRLGERTMDLVYTYVPEELRGKGIAEALVEEVLEYADANNMKIIPTCSYIELYLIHHAAYNRLVAT